MHPTFPSDIAGSTSYITKKLSLKICEFTRILKKERKKERKRMLQSKTITTPHRSPDPWLPTFPVQQWGQAPAYRGDLSCPPAQTHLHEQGDGVEPEDLHAVHGVPGEDVQGSSAALLNRLHPHAILHKRGHWGMATGDPWTWPHSPQHSDKTSLVLRGAPVANCLPECTHSHAHTCTQRPSCPQGGQPQAPPAHSPCRAAGCLQPRGAGHPDGP